MKKVAVVLGRFQPFHLGHLHYIKKYLDDFDELLVIIGSADQYRSKRNPFTYFERREFIINALREASVEIPIHTKYLLDNASDIKWQSKVRELLQDDVEYSFIYRDKDFDTTSSNTLVTNLGLFKKQINVQDDSIPSYNATDIRHKLSQGCSVDSLTELPESVKRILNKFPIKDVFK